MYIVPKAVADEMAESLLRESPYGRLFPIEVRPLSRRARLRFRWLRLRERIGFWVAGYQPEEEW